MTHSNPPQPQSFADAGQAAQRGLLGEFVGFMSDNAKWWLIPFGVVFGLLGTVLVLGSTGAAPFIYALF